jgi:putative ABC transport system permease protein
VSSLKDVSAAAGTLVLNDVKLSGTVSAGSGQPGARGAPGGSGGAGSINSNSFTVTGVNPSDDSLGPLSSGTITSGHDFTTAESDSNVAVVDSNYAQAQNLKVGSTVTVAGKTFSVVGIVQAAQGESPADVFIPLARAQALANMPNEVNTIYVSAASASDISAVSGEISRALPTATVTTSANLASEVTGSLSSASTLANSLGKWLAVAVLAAAFGPGICPPSCPAASSSGWPSRAPWSRNREFSSRTSPPGTSAKAPATRSWPSWKSCGASAASPS